MKQNNRILSTPLKNVLLNDEIKKLQLQLNTEKEKYIEALKQDKVLQEVKPIRLQIRFLQEKIAAIKSNAIYHN